MKRSFYIDNLRIALTALVVVQHTIATYTTSNSWYYIVPEAIEGYEAVPFSTIMSVNTPFLMNFFFFISAYLMPHSYDKKGFSVFLKDRCIRLGIPLLFFILLINPCINYLVKRHTGTTTLGLGEFIWTSIMQYHNIGIMWFVLTLLIFETIYALYRKFSNVIVLPSFSDTFPSNLKILLFILTFGFLIFMIRIAHQKTHNYALFIAMFIFGIIANRKGWLEKISFKTIRIWFWLAVVNILLIAFFIAYNNFTHQVFFSIKKGASWNALLYALRDSFLSVGLISFLLVTFKKYLNTPNRFSVKLAADSYLVYMIHPLIVLSCTFMLEPLELSPVIACICVFMISIPVCFLISHLLRKIPGVKNIF